MTFAQIEKKIDNFFETTDKVLKEAIFWLLTIGWSLCAVLAFCGAIEEIFRWKMARAIGGLIVCLMFMGLAYFGPRAFLFVLNGGPEKWFKGLWRKLITSVNTRTSATTTRSSVAVAGSVESTVPPKTDAVARSSSIRVSDSGRTWIPGR